MYGAYVHEAVLAAGETETGVTIHWVDAEYDQGAILAQSRVPVLPGDRAVTLGQRVLACEQRFLVETLQQIVAGTIVLPSREW